MNKLSRSLAIIIVILILASCSKSEIMYCGFDDGPFTAEHTDSVALDSRSKTFDLSDQGLLLIDNQTDSLPPILSLYEEGQLEWSIAMELDTWRLDSIYHVKVNGNRKTIELSFIADWSFGNESGRMKIKRESGDNNYCLSW